MIAGVIADDLSGAAELAAAAADRGLSAEVHMRFDAASAADVIAVTTESRAMPANDAAAIAGRVAGELLRARPQWIYKKTDSVMRGNVRAEIEAILVTTGMSRALLISANPGKARVIRGGLYYVDGTPLAETAFAADPIHPCRSSNVLALLGERGTMPVTRAEDSVLPSRGIAVPDAENAAVLAQWAARVDHQTLPAGGVEFFQALLEARGVSKPRPSFTSGDNGTTLFVCGSAQAWGQGRAASCHVAGVPVLALPDELYANHSPAQQATVDWVQQVKAAVNQHGSAMIAVGRPADVGDGAASPAVLADRLAHGVALALRGGAIAQVYVEGGATAAALLRAMKWTRLTALPSADLAGVARLRPIDSTRRDALTLLVKPGSYPWPAAVWSALQQQKDHRS